MRQIDSHQSLVGTQGNLNSLIRVEPADDPQAGGASTKYQFWLYQHSEWMKFGRVEFQNGPLVDDELKPRLPNGISNEVLIAVLIDRLEGFQKGKFSCRENEMALQHLEEAMHWLHERTKKRAVRGVLGTTQK